MKKTTKHFLAVLTGLILFTLTSCDGEGSNSTADFSIDYEKYVLDNGLEVVLHQDDSDPIVAVSVLYHVGSNREQPGRTGFAHFCEHMLFQNSENEGAAIFNKSVKERG